MKPIFNAEKSIYLQIAEMIEKDILNNVLPEGEQVPSTNQFAQLYSINPATAAKGINLLVDEEILFKKRGIGMFVNEGAREKIMNKRKEAFFEEFILPLIQEAAALNISKKDLVKMFERGEGN